MSTEQPENEPARERPMLLDGSEALNLFAREIAANIEAIMVQTRALAQEIAQAQKAIKDRIEAQGGNAPDTERH